MWGYRQQQTLTRADSPVPSTSAALDLQSSSSTKSPTLSINRLDLHDPNDPDDPWAEHSDDEATVAALTSQSPPLSTTSHPPPPSHQVTRSVSWSFNPFSIIAPKTPAQPQTLAGAEAVAAVISGNAASTNGLTPGFVMRKPTSSSKNMGTSGGETEAAKSGGAAEGSVSSTLLGKDQEAASGGGNPSTEEGNVGPDDEQEVDAGDDAPVSPLEVQRRGSSYALEQCKLSLKPNALELVRDPVSFLYPPAACLPPLASTSKSSNSPLPAVPPTEEEEMGGGEKGRERRRRKKFVDCLTAENVDLGELRKLAWAGIPSDLRPISWQLLLGYLPLPSSRRLSSLSRKRQDYLDLVTLAFSRGVDQSIWHQISIDVPRTRPGVRLWQGRKTQKALERVLYVWAIRHPASGYVQGINDLCTPFFEVFLEGYIDSDPAIFDLEALPDAVMEAVEADAFWCLSKLLDGIQDNYIFAQPGIVRQVAKMKELCSRVDAPLSFHLEANNVEFMQFAFRWVNCLLMREMSVRNIIRMWDTYLAEGAEAFSEFHLYVCLAFLVKWSDQLREMDFQSIIMFLQSLPTQDWTDKNTELLLSEAFMWSRTFEAR